MCFFFHYDCPIFVWTLRRRFAFDGCLNSFLVNGKINEWMNEFVKKLFWPNLCKLLANLDWKCYIAVGYRCNFVLLVNNKYRQRSQSSIDYTSFLDLLSPQGQEKGFPSVQF